MKFIRLYHLGNSTVVEVFPDMYINWQPVSENQVKEKMEEFQIISKRIQKQCVVLIDCDKMIYFDKINFVLLKNMISKINFQLKVIIKNCNEKIKNLINHLNLSKNIIVYFNDIY